MDGYNVNLGIPNPLEAVAVPLAKALPNWFKLDGAGVALFLWLYLDQFGLTTNEKLMTAGGASVVHMLLHRIACSQQASIWGGESY